MAISTKDALKALFVNSGTATKKATLFTGKYLKQVGKAMATNPNKESWYAKQNTIEEGTLVVEKQTTHESGEELPGGIYRLWRTNTENN